MKRSKLRPSFAFAAALACAAPFAAPAFAATSYSTGFETFPTGDIGTQDGWSRTVNSPTKGIVTNAVAQSGSQSLDLQATGVTGVQNHQNSPSITGAGETGATVGGAIGGTPGGVGLNRFEASVWYRADADFTSLSTNRMAEFDPASGINRYAVARAYDDGTTWSLKLSDLSLGVALPVAANLNFGTWYRITMSIDFVDGLAPVTNDSNDIFTVNIFDGVGTPLGSATGGTWEEGYVGGGFGGGPLARVVDGMDFWGYGNIANMSSGAIDNVSYSALAVPEPTGAALVGLGAGALLLRRRRRTA
jgi:hypothetical protein